EGEEVEDGRAPAPFLGGGGHGSDRRADHVLGDQIRREEDDPGNPDQHLAGRGRRRLLAAVVRNLAARGPPGGLCRGSRGGGPGVPGGGAGSAVVELAPGWELMFGGRDGADSAGLVESGGRSGGFWACATDEVKQRTTRTSVAGDTRARRTLRSPPRNRVTA